MMRKLAFLLALLVAAAAPAPLTAQERKLEPLDEAAKDASWASFKRRLLAAVEKRDRKFMLGILDRRVRSGTEGGRGVAQFRRQWELDSDTRPLWHELGTPLVLPAAYQLPGQ